MGRRRMSAETAIGVASIVRIKLKSCARADLILLNQTQFQLKFKAPQKPIDSSESTVVELLPVSLAMTDFVANNFSESPSPSSSSSQSAAATPVADAVGVVDFDGDEEYERFRKECREFNIEAVRQQMDAMPDSGAP